MDRERQKQAPIYAALESFRRQRVVPFDVPGHKRGRGNPELVELLGEKCVGIDVNSMKPLDNLCHPISVIKEAEELAADAFGAAHAFLMVGGTTSSVQSMVLSACKPGDKIILPRNVHKSAINALVLCGATPVYIDPKVDKELGIPLGMETADVKEAIEKNPDAVAILINNPTYYGVCSDLKSIVSGYRSFLVCHPGLIPSITFKQKYNMIRYLFINLAEYRFIKLWFCQLDLKYLDLRYRFACCQINCGGGDFISPKNHFYLIYKHSL